jgi:hypothetical protein
MPCECTELTRVSKIKMGDKGSKNKAVVLNAKKILHHKIRADGCLIKNATAADWILTKPGVGHVIVELKGCDIDHAAHQITVTAQRIRKGDDKRLSIAGLVAPNS